jgi:hypothetical protein
MLARMTRTVDRKRFLNNHKAKHNEAEVGGCSWSLLLCILHPQGVVLVSHIGKVVAYSRNKR